MALQGSCLRLLAYSKQSLSKSSLLNTCVNMHISVTSIQSDKLACCQAGNSVGHKLLRKASWRWLINTLEQSWCLGDLCRFLWFVGEQIFAFWNPYLPHPFSITPSLLKGEQHGNELHLEFQKALQLYGDSRALSKSPPGSTKERWTTCKRCGSLHPASEQESSCFQSEDALF